MLPADVPRLKHKKFPHIFHSSSSSKKAGTAVIIKDSVAFKMTNLVEDPRGRFTIICCDINSMAYTIVSLYAPNSRQLPFIRSAIKKAKKFRYGCLLLCGDFNAVVDKQVDRTAGCARAALELKPFLHKEDLHDIWRYQHSTERDYTYYSPSKGTFSRIDLILIERHSLIAAQSASIGYITWSDHAPITITLAERFDYAGKSPWRLNNFLLKSPTIVEEINSKLSEFFLHNVGSVNSPRTIWCTHKAYIRGILVQIGAREKKRQKQTNLIDTSRATEEC